jgi:MFS transporter, PAT family, beta-lactamase induction signal transducer AmpG
MNFKEKLSAPHFWAFTTYFTEGFPFTLFRTVSAVFFRDMGVSLEGVGLTSLLGIPWIIKFLWSPALDRYATKRKWVLAMQAILVGIMSIIAVMASTSLAVPAIAALFFTGAVISATHDIAIDGYYMEALDVDGQAKFVGYRVMAYRIAMMTGTGVVVTLGTTLGWIIAFSCGAAVFAVFFVYHLFFLPEPQMETAGFSQLFHVLLRVKTLVIGTLFAITVLSIKWVIRTPFTQDLAARIPALHKLGFAQWAGILLLIGLLILALFRSSIRRKLEGSRDSNYAAAFLTFIDRDHAGIMLTFIITLRAGEWMLTTMVAPFMVDVGIKVHYGWITAAVGLPASIIGAMLGGWLISRYSLKRTIWPLIVIQNLTNILYMFLAFHLQSYVQLNTGAAHPTAIGGFNLLLVASVHGFEQFSGGLGTAVLMTYLMRICLKEHKAAHYAIGSGLMSLSGLFTGMSSGFLADWLGYGWMFGMSFVVAIPAMLVIPFLPNLDAPASPSALEGG